MNTGVAQLTITLKVQVDVFPFPSFAVAVTVVVPMAKKLFGALLYVMVGVVQLSVAVAA